MTIAIQRDKNEFLYQQVISMIQQMTNSNTISPGDRLPSLRGLSEKLSISIATVKQAYIELERLGVIESRPKSGYFLVPSSPHNASPKRVKLAKKPTAVRKQRLIEEVFDAIHRPGVVPLGVANPASVHSSDKALARIMRQVLSKAGSKAVSYGPMGGYIPLKKQLALRYFALGLQVSADEILITNGAQEAIAIALKCVAKRGDVIAVESPAYFGVLELIESYGMMALEIPLCPEDGICLDDLNRAIAEHSIKACIFSSSVSNPFGSFMDATKQRDLVRLLERNDIPLIEDDVYGDLYFTEKRGSTAQLYSKKGLVLTCSSFSKTAAPGYRVGWLVTEKFAGKARLLKRAFSCSSSLLNQWAISEFIASGEYDRNMIRLRQKLKCNKCRMMTVIRAEFPEDTLISDPKGAGVLWVELPVGNDAEDLFHAALKHNISISPGSLFSPSNKFKRCIRISYGIPWDEDVENAIKVLGSLCH